MKNKPLLILALLPLLTPSAHADFPDVSQTSEYYQSVSALQDLGIVQGYQNGEFDQSKLVSRAEFLKMALLGEMKSTNSNHSKSVFPGIENVKANLDCFPDVKATDWFAPYVCWAKENDVISGFPNGNFYPNQTVNVAEAAKILAREKDMAVGGHWANGYFQQIAPHTLPMTINAPDQLLSRADTAEMIWRYDLATEDQLKSKTSKILTWNSYEKKFLNLEFIGEIKDNPIDTFWYGKLDDRVFVLENEKLYTTDYQVALNEPIPLNEFRPELLPEANADTFKVVLNTVNHKNNKIEFPIALDKDALYDGNKKIAGSHGGNFSLLEGFFQRDDSTLTYYGRDKDVVYLINCWKTCDLSNVLANSNADTFKSLGGGFSKDKDRVYFGYSPLPEADTTTFVSLSNRYGKDTKSVFLGAQIIPSADPSSFKYLPFSLPDNSTCQSTFSKDKDHLFIESKMISEVDPSTFEFLHPYGLFFKDKNHIYHTVREAKGYTCSPSSAIILDNADLEDFQRLGSNYFLSKNKIYFVSDEGKVSLTEANPESFKVFLADEEDPDQMQPLKGYFAKDEKNIYYKNIILKDVDLQSFVFFDEGMNDFKDKNRSYTWSDIYKMAGEI